MAMDRTKQEQARRLSVDTHYHDASAPIAIQRKLRSLSGSVHPYCCSQEREEQGRFWGQVAVLFESHAQEHGRPQRCVCVAAARCGHVTPVSAEGTVSTKNEDWGKLPFFDYREH